MRTFEIGSVIAIYVFGSRDAELRSFRSMNLIQKGNSHFWIRLVSDAVEPGSSATIAFIICALQSLRLLFYGLGLFRCLYTTGLKTCSFFVFVLIFCLSFSLRSLSAVASLTSKL